MFYCFLQLYNKVNLRWLPHGQGSITSPINIINTNSFATITCYAWISNAILFFYIHYRNVHHHWWRLLPIFDLNDMVIFPIACGLGNKRGADILHANMNYRLDVNISLAKLHILFSSVVFQNKAYPLNFLCLETLNIFFALMKCLAFITVLSGNCYSYSHWAILRVCSRCNICAEEMFRYVWCTGAQGSKIACLGSIEICWDATGACFHGTLSAFTYPVEPIT